MRAVSLCNTAAAHRRRSPLPPSPRLLAVPQYDQVVLDALENKVTAKGTLKGHLDIYRYCDNVRQWEMRHWALGC